MADKRVVKASLGKGLRPEPCNSEEKAELEDKNITCVVDSSNLGLTCFSFRDGKLAWLNFRISDGNAAKGGFYTAFWLDVPTRASDNAVALVPFFGQFDFRSIPVSWQEMLELVEMDATECFLVENENKLFIPRRVNFPDCEKLSDKHGTVLVASEHRVVEVYNWGQKLEDGWGDFLTTPLLKVI